MKKTCQKQKGNIFKEGEISNFEKWFKVYKSKNLKSFAASEETLLKKALFTGWILKCDWVLTQFWKSV